MKVNAISNNCYNPDFGHSFRVNICLKNESGLGDFFVSPSSNKKLYRTLNSQLVSWLNEAYYTRLRQVFGITKKLEKPEPMSKVHHDLISQLKNIDNDYNKFQYVRSVYNKGRLAYIVTGADVSIIENVKGLKNIGMAKADPFWSNPDTKNDYIKNLSLAINNNVLEFVQHSNVLLRSKNDKEIMLRVVFKEAGKHTTGTPKYELDRFEFHENKTHPVLKPVNRNYANFKQSRAMSEEIKKTVQYQVNRILDKKIHFKSEDLDKFLNN